MNRAKANHVVQQTLFPALSLLLATSAVHAQIQHNPFAIGTGSGSGARTRTSKINPRQFNGPNLTQVPKSATQGQYRHGAKTRAPGDAAVIRQTVLISKQNPSQQFSGLSAPSQDEHLFATSDEKYLYFDSDRANDSTVPQASTGKFNIFRSFIDGSGVTQITTGTDNKIEPAVSQSGERK